MVLWGLVPATAALAASSNNPYIQSVTTSVSGDTATASSVHKPPYVHVWYQFRITSPQGHQWIARRFQSGDSFTWTPPKNATGPYEIEAYALTQFQVAHKDWALAVGSTPAVLSVGVLASIQMPTTLPALTAGQTTPDQVSVQLVNSNGTNAANETVTLTSSDPQAASVPASVTTNGNGQASFNVTAGTKADANVTITAQVGSVSTTTTVAVNPAAPAAVILSPASSDMAADGQASETLTGTVVDQYGNTVSGYNGTVGVVVNPNQFAQVPMSIVPQNPNNANANDTVNNPYWYTAKNGVVTFSVQEELASRNVTGEPTGDVGDTANVVPILPGGMLETANAATITLTAPQPTYDIVGQLSTGSNGGVIVQPLPSVLANNNAIFIAPMTADQNQVPLVGSSGIGDGGTATISVSGPATLTYTNLYGQQETNLTQVTMPIDAENNVLVDTLQLVPNPGQTGTVTVTISNATNGLKLAAPTQISVVPAGNVGASWQGPSSLSFTADQVADDHYAQQNLSESANLWTPVSSSPGSTATSFNIQAVDQNGLSVAAPQPSVNVTTASGQSVADLSASIAAGNGQGAYVVTLTYNGKGLADGTYDVTISEGLMQSLVVPMTITAGVPYQVTVTPPSGQVVDVTPDNPSLNITGQIVDVLGNNVGAPAGTTMTFEDTVQNTPINNIQSGAPLDLSGGTGSTSDQTVYVNSTGQAVIKATALAQGDDGAVDVTANLPSGYPLRHAEAESATVVETGTLVSQLTASVQNNNYVAGTSGGQSSAYPQVLVTEENAAHGPLTTGDTLSYTITSTNAFYPGASGTVNYSGPNTPIPVITDMAGTYTVQIQDLSNSSVAPISVQVTIQANSAAGVGLFANGAEVQQDVPTALNYSSDTNYNVPNTYYATKSNAETGGIAVTANQPVPVWVHVTDDTGNIVNAPAGGVTVDLSAMSQNTPSTAEFQNGAGQSINSVTIPAGQNGVEVYLVDSQSETVQVQATYVQQAMLSFAGTSKGVATYSNGSYSWDVNVADQFGNPIMGLTAADATVVDTSSSPNVSFPNSAAGNTLTLTPVSGTPGEYLLTVTVGTNETTPIATTDVANITIDGTSINGTF